MEEILVVDRIEGDIAVCENRKNNAIINMPISKLPDGVKEGSVIRYVDGFFWIDIEEQEAIEKRIDEKMNDLWE